MLRSRDSFTSTAELELLLLFFIQSPTKPISQKFGKVENRLVPLRRTQNFPSARLHKCIKLGTLLDTGYGIGFEDSQNLFQTFGGYSEKGTFRLRHFQQPLRNSCHIPVYWWQLIYETNLQQTKVFQLQQASKDVSLPPQRTWQSQKKEGVRAECLLWIRNKNFL